MNPSGAATQIATKTFDRDYFQLQPQTRARIKAKIDDLSFRLDSFQHTRLTGEPAFRLRVGDYRIVYEFDLSTNELTLLALGHRREVYKSL